VYSFAFDLNKEFLKIEEKLKNDPKNINLIMDKAFIFSHGREIERAITLYETILITHPNNARALTELCVLQTSLRDKQMAEHYCKEAVKVNPTESLVYDNLGLSYFKLGEFRASLKPFLESIALNEGSVLPQNHLANSFLALREYVAAETYLKTLLNDKLNSLDSAMIYHGLYYAYEGVKDYDRALQAILMTYRLSGNSLYMGKVATAFVKANQLLVFSVVALLVLLMSYYFGNRINRFLKNE